MRSACCQEAFTMNFECSQDHFAHLFVVFAHTVPSAVQLDFLPALVFRAQVAHYTQTRYINITFAVQNLPMHTNIRLQHDVQARYSFAPQGSAGVTWTIGTAYSRSCTDFGKKCNRYKTSDMDNGNLSQATYIACPSFAQLNFGYGS